MGERVGAVRKGLVHAGVGGLRWRPRASDLTLDPVVEKSLFPPVPPVGLFGVLRNTARQCVETAAEDSREILSEGRRLLFQLLACWLHLLSWPRRRKKRKSARIKDQLCSKFPGRTPP